MDQKYYLNKLHCEILEVMDEVDRICTKHDLTYYLIGGTLLGAIRHGGFIPWDDDFDIAMPREDYEKFVKLAPTELGSEFYFEGINANKHYWLMFSKVCRKNTLFDEAASHESGRSFGIFVDIFVLDTTKGISKSVKWRKWFVRKCVVMMATKEVHKQKSSFKKAISKILPLKLVNKIAAGAMKGICKKGEYYTNFASQYSVAKQTIPKKHYGEGKRVSFEDRQYCAPCEPEAVLASIFGAKYMELPPVEKRRTHYPVKVVFSDGEALTFKNTQKQIPIE